MSAAEPANADPDGTRFQFVRAASSRPINFSVTPRRYSVSPPHGHRPDSPSRIARALAGAPALSAALASRRRAAWRCPALLTSTQPDAASTTLPTTAIAATGARRILPP